MIVLRILAVLGGVVVTLWVLWSAIRTVVVPRGEAVRLSRQLFLAWREVFELWAGHTDDFESYDRIMARYGPVALLSLPVAWAVIVFAAFIPIYWGLGISWHEAVVTSGSSFTTLGFDRPNQLGPEMICFVEAITGLGLIALLISYLPAIYSAFSRREAEVIKLEVRAGSPPSAAEFLIRIYRIRGLEYFATQWDSWEQWFSELEESHTSQPALAFFRSPRPRSSWITAAGTVLDTASIIVSCLDIDQNPRPRSPSAPATWPCEPSPSSSACPMTRIRPRMRPSRSSATSSMPSWTSCARPGCRCEPTSIWPGATTPAGGSTTTSPCWGCARWRRRRRPRGRRTASRTWADLGWPAWAGTPAALTDLVRAWGRSPRRARPRPRPRPPRSTRGS